MSTRSRDEKVPSEADVRAEHSRLAEMTAIALRCAGRPVVSRMSEDDILGYDEWGAPTR